MRDTIQQETRDGELQTCSGRYVHPLRPDPEQIHLGDIFHHLSHLCRFAGAVRGFYSVGRHSLNVCDYLRATGAPLDVQAWGMLHDAPEYLLVDIPRPLKHMPEMGPYRVAENLLSSIVWERFLRPLCTQLGPLCRPPGEIRARVDAADKLLLKAEQCVLMPRSRDRETQDGRVVALQDFVAARRKLHGGSLTAGLPLSTTRDRDDMYREWQRIQSEAGYATERASPDQDRDNAAS